MSKRSQSSASPTNHQCGSTKPAGAEDDESSLTTNNNTTGSSSSNMQMIRYLEFYAGVGGWTMALQEAVSTVFSENVRLECCAALDHSDLCTSVYQYNHHVKDGKKDGVGETNGIKKAKMERTTTNNSIKAVRIERLTAQQLIDWKADLWMMSPPCQPHTRQHSNQEADLDDVRSDSFLHLCNLLVQLESAAKPSIILLENVVGFEGSNSFRAWTRAVATSNYVATHFHLQPTQAGLPNDRPRYYCVAVHIDKLHEERADWIERYFQAPVTPTETSDSTPLHPCIHSALPELDLLSEDAIDREKLPLLRGFLDKTDVDRDAHLRVPESVLQRPAAWCLDIVTADSRRTSCFTSAYGKYVKGTGSVLLQPDEGVSSNTTRDASLQNKFAMVPPEERQYDPDWAAAITNSGYNLRYFSGSELARLFGFCDAFSFPANVTVKQQWKLVGNSLNVRIASKMAELGLRSVYGTSKR